ncbi:high affinity phosphate transporter [Ectocarpus siliculosus]|uniref:High affinity phosphate transporter n=1 Tax=Ectocarpus siliculosus TaxID=2880 RepID=D7G5U7_ECTSI|nr:high affinity phosphate transporter [Ectocarpus siliculosus]|eukprot:CBJ33891.1 high affinity phosphate transporter [Ectocarpus siliculosus]
MPPFICSGFLHLPGGWWCSFNFFRPQHIHSSSERILAPEATDQFLWILIVAAFGAFFAAFGIGANDVANAFATSVGAKALTIKQAVVLAGVFEFLGAVFLGSHVTKTIRKGIADIECFQDNPGILMYGNMCVVYTTGIWLLLASFFELPVSTTHSTIGGIVGMAMTYRGAGCVVWYEKNELFPYFTYLELI